MSDPNAPNPMLFRRADIRHRIHKVRNLALAAMRSAEAEGQEQWRDVTLHKVRMLNALLIEIDAKCPVFQAAELTRVDLAAQPKEINP